MRRSMLMAADAAECRDGARESPIPSSVARGLSLRAAMPFEFP